MEPHSALQIMGEHLKEKMNATDEELAEMQDLMDLRVTKRQQESKFRFSYAEPSLVIDDFLYHGDLGHATSMKLLSALNIKHIVNVCDCPLDSSITSEFDVKWINLDDSLTENIRKHFDDTNDFIAKCKEKNEKVLVHCQAGISRSSSVVLAYLMK